MQLSIVAKEVGSKSHLATSFIRMSNICHCDRMDTHTWHRSLHLSAETVTSMPSLQYCLIFSGSFVSAVTRVIVFGEAMVDHVANLKSLTCRFFSLNSHTTVCSDSVWQCREWKGWNGDLEGERWLWGAQTEWLEWWRWTMWGLLYWMGHQTTQQKALTMVNMLMIVLW